VSEPFADRAMMARALALAERGRGTVRPNPMVGCVLVRDGRIVGEGHHAAPGGPHAEVVALQAAGGAANGATAYVSLEPCDHRGRTGPCTTALRAAGVVRVVYALDDPDPVAAGGAERLRAAGIEVVGGLMRDAAGVQNEVFVHAKRTGRPFVTLKLAQTLDGVLHIPGRTWITGTEARTEVHRLRAASDAVLVGSGTVLADDPRLDVRHVVAPSGQPRPVVFDASGRIPSDAAVVRLGAVVVTTAKADDAWVAALTSGGVEVMVTDPGADGGVDLRAALRGLGDRDVQTVLAEPGPRLARALVDARLVDRLVAHIAVSLVGDDGLPRLTPHVEPAADAGWRWDTERTGTLGADVEVVAVPRPTDVSTDVPIPDRRS
jgi:diaminohydroxyphosphoribosylaminopyrimidine deaminase/5-amino-6-(5-phosphoribosylamino)uracil reductase